LIRPSFLEQEPVLTAVRSVVVLISELQFIRIDQETKHTFFYRVRLVVQLRWGIMLPMYSGWLRRQMWWYYYKTNQNIALKCLTNFQIGDLVSTLCFVNVSDSKDVQSWPSINTFFTKSIQKNLLHYIYCTQFFNSNIRYILSITICCSPYK